MEPSSQASRVDARRTERNTSLTLTRRMNEVGGYVHCAYTRITQTPRARNVLLGFQFIYRYNTRRVKPSIIFYIYIHTRGKGTLIAINRTYPKNTGIPIRTKVDLSSTTTEFLSRGNNIHLEGKNWYSLSNKWFHLWFRVSLRTIFTFFNEFRRTPVISSFDFNWFLATISTNKSNLQVSLNNSSKNLVGNSAAGFDLL